MRLIKKLCEWQEPKDVANALIQEWGHAGFIWLDGDGSPLGRWVTLATKPIDEKCCRRLTTNQDKSNPFEILRNLEEGHWTGWLSYEAGAWIEPKNTWKLDSMATLWIASHDPILKFDLHTKQLWIEGSKNEDINSLANWLENSRDNLNKKNINSNNIENKYSIPINSWKWLTNEKGFLHQVDEIKNLIASGDLFQANLSTCCTAEIPVPLQAIEIFNRLRNHCPAPFSAFIGGSGEAKGEIILSSSPERFMKVLPNGEVETRPIKGTRPRNLDPIKDAELAADLVCSTKDRAENIMIVDLLRNDLGKVCQPGTIKVSQLVGLETYAKVHHLTSVINGFLQSSKEWVDVLEASWPGGSISGAPKIRACERLQKLEPTARGPYCGSLLHIDWNGTFDSNILIRSLMIKDQEIRAHAGCGIVADSNSQTEAEELKWKLIPLLEALE